MTYSWNTMKHIAGMGGKQRKKEEKGFSEKGN